MIFHQWFRLISCFTRRKVQRYSYKRWMIMRRTGSRAARSANEHFFHAIPEVHLFPRRNRKNRWQRRDGGNVKGNISPLFRFTFVVSLLECDELWKTLAVSPRYASPAGMTNSSFSTFFTTVLQLRPATLFHPLVCRRPVPILSKRVDSICSSI